MGLRNMLPPGLQGMYNRANGYTEFKGNDVHGADHPGQSPRGASSSEHLRTIRAGLPRPGSSQANGKKDRRNDFSTAGMNQAERDAFIDDLAETMIDATPEEKRKLVPDAAAMQLVLEEIASGTIPPGKEKQHAVVQGHLKKLLTLQPSAVKGVQLTRFSHIRHFDDVIPRGFKPVDVCPKHDILEASLRYAQNPTATPPCNVFTFDQFINGDDPVQNPNLPPPTRGGSIHGRDMNDNSVVGLRGDHPGMADIMAALGHSHSSPFEIPRRLDGMDPWRETAWLAALMQLDPEDLETHLTKKLQTQPPDNDTTSKIKKMCELAKKLQSFIRQASKDGAKAAETRAEIDDALSQIRLHTRDLTDKLLSEKKRLNDANTKSKEEDTQPDLASLMCALGVPCVVERHEDNDPGSKPDQMMYHASSIGLKKRVFAKHNIDEEKAFFDEAVMGVPIVVITEKGVHLKLPKVLRQPVKKESPASEDTGESTTAPPSPADAPSRTKHAATGNPFA